MLDLDNIEVPNRNKYKLEMRRLTFSIITNNHLDPVKHESWSSEKRFHVFDVIIV